MSTKVTSHSKHSGFNRDLQLEKGISGFVTAMSGLDRDGERSIHKNPYLKLLKETIKQASNLDEKRDRIAEALIVHLGFQRIKYYSVLPKGSSYFVKSEQVWERVEGPAGQIQITKAALEASKYYPGKFVEAESAMERTILMGQRIVSDVASEPYYRNEFTANDPFVMVRVVGDDSKVAGVLKADAFEYSPTKPTTWVEKDLQDKMKLMKSLVENLTLELISNNPASFIQHRPINEIIQANKKNLHRINDIRSLQKVLIQSSSLTKELFIKIGQTLLSDRFGFTALRVYYRDPATNTVKSGRVMEKGDEFPHINFNSSYWNTGFGRMLHQGEIFETAARTNRPIVVADPANDYRCSETRNPFLDDPSSSTKPFIVFPIGPYGKDGFIKLDGSSIDMETDIEQMYGSLYERLMILEPLIKQIQICREEEMQLPSIEDTWLKEFKLDIFDNISPLEFKISTLRIMTKTVFLMDENGLVIDEINTMLTTDSQGPILLEALRFLKTVIQSSHVSLESKTSVFDRVVDLYRNNTSVTAEMRLIMINILSLLQRFFPKSGISWHQVYFELSDISNNPRVISAWVKSMLHFIHIRSIRDKKQINEYLDIIKRITYQSPLSKKDYFHAWGVLALTGVLDSDSMVHSIEQMKEYLKRVPHELPQVFSYVATILNSMGNVYAFKELPKRQRKIIEKSLFKFLNHSSLHYRQVAIVVLGDMALNPMISRKKRMQFIDKLILQLYDSSPIIQESAISVLVNMSHEAEFIVREYQNAGKASKHVKSLLKEIINTYNRPNDLSGARVMSVDLNGEGLGFASVGPKSENLIKLNENIKRISQLLHVHNMYVPNEVTLASTEYQEFIRQAKLSSKLEKTLTAIDFEQSAPDLQLQLQTAHEKIENLFIRTELPPEIKYSLGSIFMGHKEYFLQKGILFPGFAARSAADDEDKKDTTAAGRYATFPNIQTLEELEYYVKRVWASLWSPEAMIHRNLTGLSQAVDTVKMSVIIQIMAPEVQTSGVIFVQNNDGCLDMEISAGFGQSCGTRNNDNTDLIKVKGTEIQIEIERQYFQIITDEEGEEKQVELSIEEGSRQKLTTAQIEQLILSARELSNDLLSPGFQNTLNDLEFAIVPSNRDPGYQIAWLQQRYMTMDEVTTEDVSNFESTPHVVSSDKEPYIYGKACGMVQIMTEEDVFDEVKKRQILKHSGGKILVSNRLDEENLPLFFGKEAPAFVIIEIGSKASHIVREADQLLRKYGRRIPVIKIQHATQLFAGISEVSIEAKEGGHHLYFQNEKDKQVFIERQSKLNDKKETTFAEKYSTPAKPVISIEDYHLEALPVNQQTLLKRTDYEVSIQVLIEKGTDLPGKVENVLNSLYAINTMRKDLFTTSFTSQIEAPDEYDRTADYLGEIYMFFISIQRFGTPGKITGKIQTAGIENGKRLTDPEHSLYQISTIIHQTNQLIEVINKTCWKGQWSPRLLEYYCPSPHDGLIPSSKSFAIHAKDWSIIVETSDDELIFHDAVYQLFPVSEKPLLLRGLTQGSVNGGGKLWIGFRDTTLFNTTEKQAHILAEAAGYFLKQGFHPNLDVQIMEAGTMFGGPLKEHMTLFELSRI
ncbi:MAG: hypothetical protein HQM14_06465 [SAR324 cluster bacterium]|nr:hypothetical protein [SAR324 cluster bacterium]